MPYNYVFLFCLFLGYINCLNDEDCLGANKLCFRNTTMKVGKCICKEGFKPAKEDPIKCLNIGKKNFKNIQNFKAFNVFLEMFPLHRN